MKKKLVGVCVLTLAIAACLGGVAFAKAFHAKANIQKGNVGTNCSESDPALPVLGTVSFKRVGNIVTLKVAVKHGEPNTKYEVILLANYPGCFGYGNPSVSQLIRRVLAKDQARPKSRNSPLIRR